MMETPTGRQLRKGRWFLAAAVGVVTLGSFALRVTTGSRPKAVAPVIQEVRRQAPIPPRGAGTGEAGRTGPTPPSRELLVATRPAAVTQRAAAPLARSFATPEEELTFLRERLPGERFTLQSRERARRGVEELLTRRELPQRDELERRALSLAIKHEEQAQRVLEIEKRIKALE